MPFFFRVLVTGLLLMGGWTGCSTPGKRAREHAAAFQRLSPSDRQLVLHGHVRPGMSQEGVYIAWGEPDKKTVTASGGKDGAATEVWIYRQRVTLTEPQNSYDYFGPYHGYGNLPAEPWLRPGYGIGGIGNEGMLQYQPHVRSMDTLRLAEFSGRKVDRFKTAETAWSPRALDATIGTSSSRLIIPNSPEAQPRNSPIASHPRLHHLAHRARAASMTPPHPRYAGSRAKAHHVRRPHLHRQADAARKKHTERRAYS